MKQQTITDLKSLYALEPKILTLKFGDEPIPLIKGLTLRIVDGTQIRRDDDCSFLFGSNGKANPRYVGKHEIVLEKILPPIERMFIVAHEFIEYELMSEGMSYDRAHAHATQVEHAIRKDPKAFGL